MCGPQRCLCVRESEVENDRINRLLVRVSSVKDRQVLRPLEIVRDGAGGSRGVIDAGVIVVGAWLR